MNPNSTAAPPGDSGDSPAPGTGPLTEADFELLDRLLDEQETDDAMIVEELDGFLTALACCAEEVPPAQYVPEILGLSEQVADANEGSAAPELLVLIERHYRQIAAALAEQRFAPVLAYDEHGEPDGVAWAVGFLRGAEMRPDGWAAMLGEQEFADTFDAVELLASTLDDESPVAERGLGRREREAAIDQMIADVADIHEFFRPFRKAGTLPQDMRIETVRRDQPKVGRNDPCPCGSGRKYKLCHGR